MHNQPIRDILRSSTALHNNIKEEEEEEGGKEVEERSSQVTSP